MKWTSSRLVALSLSLISIISLFWWLTADNDTLARSRTEAGLRIGYAIEAPYAFLALNGEVTGEAPEIARHIAAQLGVSHIEWRQTEFGNLIDELEAGQIDVVAAGMFITPERSKRVRFSDPTLHVRPGLLVASGNPKRILSLHDAAKRSDIRIAILAGAVEEQILQQLGTPGERLLIVPDATTGRQAIEIGLADALSLSEPTVRWMAHRAELGQTEILNISFKSQEESVYGKTAFVFRSTDHTLLTAWNKAQQGFLHSPQHTSLLAEFGLGAIDKEMSITQGTKPQ